jgi:hypothetical protein
MTDFLYGREFCSTRWKHRAWQKQLGYDICKMFKLRSVIDFGCSIGCFLEGFMEAGASIKGYEVGYVYSQEFTSENVLRFISPGDLTEPIAAKISDCSFSIEVAEHIDEEYSDQLVANLCNNSKRYIIMSAAPVGQGGVGHINCHDPEYWISRIEGRGFMFQKKSTARLLKLITDNKNNPKWMRNIMVFKCL